MIEPLQCIVGLGNPGSKYEHTRHNAGFWYIDALARQLHVELSPQPRFNLLAGQYVGNGHKLWLLKPLSYMNQSGQPVGEWLRYYKLSPERLLVAHDELDLPPGIARLKRNGGHGGHNGLRSLIQHLGSKNFARLRLGIGHPGHREQVIDHVLTRPSAADQAAIDQAINQALESSPEILAGTLDKAMNRLHSSD